MGVEYDFYQNPIPKGSDRKQRMHARVVTKVTVTTNDLAEIICTRSSLTAGDVKSALISLSELVVQKLGQGMRVHLDGLGYFSLVLDCPPVKTDKEVRAESIRVKNVAFRADAELKKEVAKFKLERVRHKNKSKDCSDIEIDALLTAYFMDHDYITASDFCRICGLTSTTGGRRIRKLIDEKRLVRQGYSRSSMYAPVPGNYRR